MRRGARPGWAILLVTLLSVLPLASAQSSGLFAAVAPGQTVVDAAARIVGLGLEEADRDGTPDQARDIYAQLHGFVIGLELDWVIPPRATYREEALAARAYGREIVNALDQFADAAATVSITVNTCDGAELATATRDALVLAAAELDATARRLEALGANPPRGIDADALQAAASQIDAWVVDYDIDIRCVLPDEPYLVLRVEPSTTWPSGRARVVGATNDGGTAHVASEGLVFDAYVPVVSQRFHHEFQVSADAPLEYFSISADTDSLSAATTLRIDRAPSDVVVRGALQTAPGTAVNLTVHLLSPLRERVANTTLHVSGATNATIPLQDGRGPLAFGAPAMPGRYVINISYAGDARVQPVERGVVLRVAVPPPLVATPAADRLRAADTHDGVNLPATTWLLSAVLVMAAAAGALTARAGRTRTAIRKSTGSAGLAPESSDIITATSTLVTVFAAIVAWLRRAGRVPAGRTAREVAVELRGWGADPGEVVFAFERARYDRSTRDEPLAPRARAWAERAWARVREVFV